MDVKVFFGNPLPGSSWRETGFHKQPGNPATARYTPGGAKKITIKHVILCRAARRLKALSYTLAP